MEKHDTLVVVLNWNRATLTEKCVRSLMADASQRKEIMIVDNGSSEENSRNMAFHDVRIERLTSNTGFSRGMNHGIKIAIEEGFRYVLCLNNDVEVENGFLDNLLKPFNNSTMGGACPLVMQKGEANRVISKGRDVHLGFGFSYCNFSRSVRENVPLQTSKIRVLDGSCMLFSTDVLRKLGAFDPAYEGGEDIELSLRIIRAGYTLLAVPTAVVWHVGAASKGGRLNATEAYQMGRNWPRLVKRYGTPRERAMFWPLFVGIQLPLWGSAWTYTGRVRNITQMIRGIAESKFDVAPEGA